VQNIEQSSSEEASQPHCNFSVFVDEKRIQQVILNYQSNAIKFVDKDHNKVLILVQKVRSLASNYGEVSAKRELEYISERIHDFYGQGSFMSTSFAVEN